MRLEIGGRIDCSEGTLAELADVVIDPTTNRVTHLVARAKGQPWVERLVPIELADTGDAARRAVALRATAEELRSLPPVQEVAYPQLGDFPLDDPDWDVGIKDVYAPPSYPAYDLEPGPVDVPVVYDRIPKGGVEIRRASDVYSAERHHLGHVDGLIVDRDEHITHLVLERGHLWGRREVTIPISAVAKFETDDVTLNLTKDHVGSLPEVAVQRRPSLNSEARFVAAGREEPVEMRVQDPRQRRPTMSEVLTDYRLSEARNRRESLEEDARGSAGEHARIKRHLDAVRAAEAAATAAAREAGSRFENALEDLGTRLAIARHRLVAEVTNDRRLFERAVEGELREWRIYGERLRERSAAEGGSEAERLQLALAELDSRQDEILKRLHEMRTAPDETWRERRERVDTALDELEHAADAL
jgi:hypothetical protein